jgi:hypothetical protein
MVETGRVGPIVLTSNHDSSFAAPSITMARITNKGVGSVAPRLAPTGPSIAYMGSRAPDDVHHLTPTVSRPPARVVRLAADVSRRTHPGSRPPADLRPPAHLRLPAHALRRHTHAHRSSPVAPSKLPYDMICSLSHFPCVGWWFRVNTIHPQHVCGKRYWIGDEEACGSAGTCWKLRDTGNSVDYENKQYILVIMDCMSLLLYSAPFGGLLLEHSVKCRSLLQHRNNSVILTEDINSLEKKLIMIFHNIR